MGVFIDLTGRKFQLWTVLKRNLDVKNKSVTWDCVCDCGVTRAVNSGNLLCGGSNGCGCVRKEKIGRVSTTHGQTKNRKIPPTYHSWAGMKARCTNPGHIAYSHYGAKGIEVCESWQDYRNFYSDMGEKPPGMSIDRINPLGNYEPSNCRWANDVEQANNKNNNHLITAFGKTKTLQEWSSDIGISHGALLFRIYKAKWPIERALTTPGRGYGGRKLALQ